MGSCGQRFVFDIYILKSLSLLPQVLYPQVARGVVRLYFAVYDIMGLETRLYAKEYLTQYIRSII